MDLHIMKENNVMEELPFLSHVKSQPEWKISC